MWKAHLLLAVFWILFGILHSWLAAPGAKQRLAAAAPPLAKHYRIFYVLMAFATLFAVVMYQVSLTSPVVFARSFAGEAMGFLICLSGLVVMGICIKKYFISLSGLRSLVEETPAAVLMLNGIHRYVRHPLYSGTFMAIWGAFFMYPLLSLLISNTIITLYTLIGIRYEERKLVAEFGAAYTAYQKRVPKLLPALKKKTYYSA